LEEERRLAYVGITRARKRLCITHAANRRIYNQYQSSAPSRFIAEIPTAHAEQLSGGSYQQIAASVAERAKAIMGEGRTSYASLHNTASSASRISAGAVKPPASASHKSSRVFHQKFGYGRIIAEQGDHLTIRFDKAGEKKVMRGFVEMVS
jgi:DNA helicase-2/ATP-dependent DNA helicase PcrA